MTDIARDRILQRLHKAAAQAPDLPPTACLPIAAYDRAQRLERLTTLMSAMRTQIEVTTARDWLDRLREIMAFIQRVDWAAGDDIEEAVSVYVANIGMGEAPCFDHLMVVGKPAGSIVTPELAAKEVAGDE